MKTIDVIGSGAVAEALAYGFGKEGYTVILSSRERPVTLSHAKLSAS